MTICFVTTICDIRFAKKENSPLFLEFISSNCCQLPFRLATLLLSPSHFASGMWFQAVFMVLVPDNVYSTDSLQLSKDFWQEDIKCIFITSVFSEEIQYGRQCKRSNLFPSLSFQWSDSERGHTWFSWWKNFSRLPSRCWQAMYNLKKEKYHSSYLQTCIDFVGEEVDWITAICFTWWDQKFVLTIALDYQPQTS